MTQENKDFSQIDYDELKTTNTNFGSTHLRTDKSIQPTTLIQLSGGIDSTFVLYDWLINNPNEYCLVHHINNINIEGRFKNEYKAVHNILSWLDKQGLKNYIYLENTFDYGNLGWILKDVELCGFHIAIIFRNLRWKNLKNVFVPLYSWEQETLRYDRAKKVISQLSVKNIQLHFPLLNLTKEQVIGKLPKDLLELCWYCRKPNGENKCNICKTCIEVNNIINKIK